MNNSSNLSINAIPLFVQSTTFPVLVLGGTELALNKTKELLSIAPAAWISVAAEKFIVEFDLVKNNLRGIIIQDHFHPETLAGYSLVISCIDDLKFALYLNEITADSKILVEHVCFPSIGTAKTGQVVTKNTIQIAINSDEAIPVIAPKLKNLLQRTIPEELTTSTEQLNALGLELNGSFSRKLNRLNKLTNSILEKKKRKWHEFNWKKIGFNALGTLIIMLAGHLLFTLIPLYTIWDSASFVVSQLDIRFAYYMLGGFIAQMIDGALGMAYGVSATTFLLSFGISPAVASMSVHASEIFTSGVSGLMHLKFGNVHNKLFKAIVVPGVLGAIAGAYLLSEFEQYNHYIKPIVGTYTLFLGALIIYKVVRKKQNRQKVKNAGLLATAGGFLDSIGGGGWGPVVSSTLIARGKNPRLVVGSVNLAEFFVSLASSFTFFTLIGGGAWQPIAGLILGGVCAAPIAAHLSRKLNVKAMMLMVGIIIVIVSLRIILKEIL